MAADNHPAISIQGEVKDAKGVSHQVAFFPCLIFVVAECFNPTVCESDWSFCAQVYSEFVKTGGLGKGGPGLFEALIPPEKHYVCGVFYSMDMSSRFMMSQVIKSCALWKWCHNDRNICSFFKKNTWASKFVFEIHHSGHLFYLEP